MEREITIMRYDPASGAGQRYESYRVEVTTSTTVLDCLSQIKDEQDPTLTFRSACRVGACGDCATRINGRGALTCKVRVLPELEEYGALRVEPLAGYRVIRDLVVDLDPLWERLGRAEPWAEPAGTVPPLSAERLSEVQRASFCNLCGVCHSECPAVKANDSYVGPAVLGQIYRYAIDPHDARAESRAPAIARAAGGPFDCVRCHLCEEVCPKDVAPAQSVAGLRRLALRSGVSDVAGARHTRALAEDLRRHGRPREVSLAARTWGYNPVALLKGVPQAARMWLAGRLEWRASTLREVEEIRRVAEATRGEE